MMLDAERKRKCGLKRSEAVGYSQADKARNRARILEEAAKQIRDRGLDSVSVGTLMQSVQLTHGGFYGHFESRSELIAQALKRALLDGESTAKAARDTRTPRTFTSIVKSYLSRTHRNSRTSGCAIAALASDVARADESCKSAMEHHINDFIARVAGTLGHKDESAAMLAVSAMVGAVALSRVITDEKRSDELLRTVRNSLIDALGEDHG